MKRILLTVVLMFVMSPLFSFSNGYTGPFNNKDLVVQGGIGLVLDPYGDIVIPPLSVAVDFGNEFDLGNGKSLPLSYGGIFSIYKTEYSYNYYYNSSNYVWSYTYIVVGARAALHLNKYLNIKNKNVDLYSGLMVGYNIVSYEKPKGWNYDSYDTKDSYLVTDFFAGARYFFSPSLAGFAELGYGVEWLKLGLSFKL